MNNKPAAPSPAAAGVEQVAYLGLAHYLRAKGWVAKAATLIAAQPKRPDVAELGQAMLEFGKVTPKAAGAPLVHYFLALVERTLLERRTLTDPLVIYSLQQALEKIATQRMAPPGPTAQ